MCANPFFSSSELLVIRLKELQVTNKLATHYLVLANCDLRFATFHLRVKFAMTKRTQAFGLFDLL